VCGAQVAFQVSERRACRGLVIHRAMIRYHSVKPADAPVRRRLHELAKDRPAFGVKRLHTMLRRDGLVINLKKVRRLYLEVQLKPRRRRRRSSTVRLSRTVVSGPNERWAMDFMHDVLATGQHVRVFTLVDVYSRECVALEVATSFSGADVARLLSDAGERASGLLPIIQCDNGTAFTSTALDHWAYWNRLQLDFSRPGKPVDNSICEAFNGSLRRECLTRHWFASLLEAQTELSTWRADYNNLRPHTSVGMHTPAQYRASGDYLPRSLR
jgi:putative transposase